VIAFAAEIVGYVFMVMKTINGLITIGDLVIFFQAFQKGKPALSDSLLAMVKLMEHRLFLSHFIRFMELEPNIKDYDGSRPLSGPITQSISLKGVLFRYPKTKVFTVKDISIVFPVAVLLR
jgi:ATP-binding cassette subfamily B protein